MERHRWWQFELSRTCCSSLISASWVVTTPSGSRAFGSPDCFDLLPAARLFPTAGGRVRWARASTLSL